MKFSDVGVYMCLIFIILTGLCISLHLFYIKCGDVLYIESFVYSLLPELSEPVCLVYENSGFRTRIIIGTDTICHIYIQLNTPNDLNSFLSSKP